MVTVFGSMLFVEKRSNGKHGHNYTAMYADLFMKKSRIREGLKGLPFLLKIQCS
jgi:hypothetical protein